MANTKQPSDKSHNEVLPLCGVSGSQNIVAEANDFIKNNCNNWCGFDYCHLRACEKPDIKAKIISGEI